MEFEDFLQSKNIDAQAFAKAEPALYQEWKTLFTQVHVESFVMQKKFLINPLRRKYQLTNYTPSEKSA